MSRWLFFGILCWAALLSTTVAQPTPDYFQNFDDPGKVLDNGLFSFPQPFDLMPRGSGQAIVLRNNSFIQVAPLPNRTLNDQTISFLFRPLTTEESFPLLSVEHKSGSILSVRFENQALIVTEPRSYSDTIQPVTADRWYHCTLSIADDAAQLKVQSVGLFDTYRFTGNFSAQAPTVIIGGKAAVSTSQKVVLVDELQLFNSTFNPQEAQALFSQYMTQLQPKILKPNATFKNRENQTQDRITTSSNQIYLEIWDNDKVDKDQLSIYHNGERINAAPITLTRKKSRYLLTLDPDTTNQVLFWAENMGEYDSYNTTALKVTALNTTDSTYSLGFNMQQNAIFEIRHQADHQPEETVKEIMPQNQEEEIITKEQSIQIRLSDHSIKDNEEVSFKLNDDVFTHITIEEDPLVFFYDLKIGKNRLVVQPKNTKLLKCTPEVIITNKKGEVLNKYKLKLGKKEASSIPIRFSPLPSTKDTIYISGRDLLFEILDPAGNDGDRVSVFQDGKLLLRNYELNREPYELPIKIHSEGVSVFQIRSDDTGKFSGNTCRIDIYYPNVDGTKGKKVTELQMRSYAKEDPAVLVIFEK